MNILLAEDSITNQMLIKAYIEKMGHSVTLVDDGQKAVDAFKINRPDVVIMDVEMPVMDGIEATIEIRKITSTDQDWVPIIFLSGKTESEDIARGIQAGGDDYLTKPIDGIVLNAKMNAMARISAMKMELQKITKTFAEMAMKDGLTGLYNRRHFDEIMSKEFKRSFRTKTTLSLVLCDIDYFKLYNDHYGHQAGDDCLKDVATAMHKAVNRPGDIVARYGGEEFAFILPETELEGALVVADTVRKAIESLGIEHSESLVSANVTISCGIASIKPETDQDLESHVRELIKTADEGLYQAKEDGRNKVATKS